LITVKVRAIFHLKEMLGAKEITLNLRRNATIKDLIQFLIEKYGKKFEDAIKNPDGGLNPIITILVNGRQIDFIGGIETKLADGDIISFIPPVGGG
jgi:molybdopterin synthase sulfur carrier subunit